MIDVTIRQATAADSEFAYQTKKAAFRAYVEEVLGWDELEQRRMHERRFAEQAFQVLQVSGQDVGILAVVREADYVKVNQLFILPEYQGRGIGRACMTRVITDAEGDGLPVRLRVLKVNPRAASFYRGLGFEETGQTNTHVELERLPQGAQSTRMKNPFLDPQMFPDQQVLRESDHCLCLFSPADSLRGSVIIVPKEPRETPFDLTEAEWLDTRQMLLFAKQHLAQYEPDGFNVGWNCMVCAGQLIPWAHLHVLPRFSDETYAGKGIRWLIKQPDNKRGEAESSPTPRRGGLTLGTHDEDKTAKDISVLVMPVTVCPALQVFREAEMIKPTAILGPHVSILGPFEPKDLTDAIIAHISDITRSQDAIECLFPQLCVFPDAPVLYLSVYPVGPFEALRNVIMEVLPDHRPKFRAPTFHLSLGVGFALAQLPALMARAPARLDQHLPIGTTLRELRLADRIDGIWETRESFRLKR